MITLIGACVVSGDSEGITIYLIGTGIAGLVIASIIYLSASTTEILPEYHLSIITAASEQQVHTTDSVDEIRSLVNAINKAKADQA